MMLFSKLKDLFTELSFENSPDKASTPITYMIFLGLIYDSNAMTVGVPDDKLKNFCAFSNYGY